MSYNITANVTSQEVARVSEGVNATACENDDDLLVHRTFSDLSK